jgi:hypothetical protein
MLRRSRSTRDTTEKPELELVFVPITRLHLILTAGAGLEFDLDAKSGDSYKEAKGFLHIEQGKRKIRIAQKNIIYFETQPVVVKQTKSNNPLPQISREQLDQLVR